MTKDDAIKIAKGAGIAAIGAVLTYLTAWISGADFGSYTPMVVAAWSIVANLVRKFITPTVAAAVVVAVLVLNGSASAAEPPKLAACDCGGQLCAKNCKDKCYCDAVAKCDPKCNCNFVKAKQAARYSEACAMVADGISVTIAVGVPAPLGALPVDSLPGIAPGVYRCFKFKKGEYAGGMYDHLYKDGQNVMVPKDAPAVSNCPGGVCGVAQPASVYSLTSPFQSSCPNGQCPNTTTYRRR